MCCLIWQGGTLGLEHFGSVVAAASGAMRSPLDEDLSIGATWTLQHVAKRLAEAPKSVRHLITLRLMKKCSFRIAKNACRGLSL